MEKPYFQVHAKHIPYSASLVYNLLCAYKAISADTTMQIIKRLLLAVCAGIFVNTGVLANDDANTCCYATMEQKPADSLVGKSLYILVDQTVPLTKNMRENILALVEDWPGTNERVKLIRFSANIRGEYTELLLDLQRDPAPSEEYLYNLRDEDKVRLSRCLEDQVRTQKSQLKTVLQGALENTKPNLGKTEILKPLKRIAESVLVEDGIKDKTVLLISSGFENSEISNFTKRKRKGNINPEQTLTLLNEKQLTTNWQGAKIYMFGLGQTRDSKTYVRYSVVEPLAQFWNLYFSNGNGDVKELGMPAILLKNLR